MAKNSQPAAATIAKVQDQLGATPRSTADLANRSGLSPSTTRKALTALADEGLAAKNEQGDWHTVVTAQAKPSDAGTPIPEATPENTRALARAAAKKALTSAVPTALNKSALSKLSREDLFAWANGLALLEHLGPDDMTIGKGKLVDEVMGALLRAEVAEDHRAAATDEVARPLAELIGFTPAPRPAKPAKAAKAAKASKAAKPAKSEAPASPLTGIAAKLAALGLSDKLARRGAALVELVASEGPLTEDECRAKLGPLSSWDFRRLVAGEHGDRRFEPLLTVEGKGSDRKYQVIG